MKKLTYLFYAGVAGVAVSLIGGIVTAVQTYQEEKSRPTESIVTPAEMTSPETTTPATQDGVAVPAQN